MEYSLNLLKAWRWLEADQETTTLILKIANREEKRYLDLESIENLSCSDLFTIDTLWVKYSHRRFGFSVQKRIWESIRDTSGGDPVLALMIGNSNVSASETCIDFANRVGWRLKDSWIDYSDLTINDDAPNGQLPYFGFFEQAWRIKVLGVWEVHSAIATAFWWRLCIALFSRIETDQK